MRKTIVAWDFKSLNDNRLKLLKLQEKLREKGKLESAYNGYLRYNHKGFTWSFRDTEGFFGEETANWCLVCIRR